MILDLSRFDAAPLIAFTATKEMNYALHGRVMRSMIPRVGLKRTDEFRQDVVRIALTSGLTVARQSLLAAMRGAQAGSIGFGRWAFDAEQMDHGTSTARQCMFTCMTGPTIGTDAQIPFARQDCSHCI